MKTTYWAMLLCSKATGELHAWSFWGKGIQTRAQTLLRSWKRKRESQ